MIAELIKLADLNGLTGCEPTRLRQIHWFIDLDSEGQVVGFSPTTARFTTWKGQTKENRGKSFTASANYHMQWKNDKVQGVCTNDSNWLPDFLSGPIAEIFPGGVHDDMIHEFRAIRKAIRDEGRRFKDRQRLHKCSLWHRMILKAATENSENRTIKAIAKFVKKHPSFKDLARFLRTENKDGLPTSLDKTGAGEEILSFRIDGRIALADSDLKQWWALQVQSQRQQVVGHLPTGSDAYHESAGPLAEYFPSITGNIALASFNAAPFASYGLGNQTTTMRVETAEKAAAGLRLLLEDKNTSMWLGDYKAVFWAVPANSEARVDGVPFVNLMVRPDPLSVKDFLNGVWGSHPGELDEAKFYAALLSIPPQGRFSLHSWHTETLNKAKENILSYFRAVALGDSDGEIPSVRQLAFATIAKSKKQKTSPDAVTVTALFQTALFGDHVPHRLLAMAILRQGAEMAGVGKQDKEFTGRLTARTALIKLYYATNKEEIMTAEKHEGETHPAYLCGRLLALFDKIYMEAHAKRDDNGRIVSTPSSSPANRFYGSASKTPALILPQMCDRARNHLDKLATNQKTKFRAFQLEYGVPEDRRSDDVPEDFEGLAAVVARLKETSGGNFPRILSLEEQGRFAIGFYYERCRQWPNFKKDKKELTEPDNQQE